MPLLALGQAAEGVAAWVRDVGSKGERVGCWRTEIGPATAAGCTNSGPTASSHPGGLAPTLAGWEAAIAPAREYTDHLVVNMYALDGAPRITHIWAFAGLEERATPRARAYAAGVWPPRGGPEQIVEATSTIALPQGSSPLA